MSRAFSLLLTVRDFQIGTNSLSFCLAIASFDLTSSSHDALELNIAPRYLNDLVSLRVHLATVTVIGFGSSQTFITSVFLPFIFMPSSVAASCKRLTMSCNSSSVLAISTMSSAYRRLVIHLPPILNLPYPSSALRINNSATPASFLAWLGTNHLSRHEYEHWNFGFRIALVWGRRDVRKSHVHYHFPQFLVVYFVKGFFEVYETHVQRLPSGPSFFCEDSEAAKVIVRTSLWPETRLFLSYLEFSFGCDPSEDDLW